MLLNQEISGSCVGHSVFKSIVKYDHGLCYFYTAWEHNKTSATLLGANVAHSLQFVLLTAAGGLSICHLIISYIILSFYPNTMNSCRTSSKNHSGIIKDTLPNPASSTNQHIFASSWFYEIVGLIFNIRSMFFRAMIHLCHDDFSHLLQ